MADPTFETRLTDALGRFADRVPTEVDATRMVRALSSVSTRSSIPRRAATGRDPRLALAVVVLIAVTLAGVVVFGGRLLAPVPPVVVSPIPSTAPVTPTPTAATASSTPVLSSTPAAVLQWTEQDIGTQPAVTSIWRVGEWFVAVGPESSFADDDQPMDARFIRSRDGHAWEAVPAPARGLEIETGTVDDGVLWVVGKLGTSADPKRGIWSTRDGETWQRAPNVKGLDFGPGRVDEISPTRNGWAALARRWIDAEAQEGFMLSSIDGVRWSRVEYPEVEGQWGIVGLVSDGNRWLLAIQTGTDAATTSLQALTSEDGTTWTPHPVATLEQGGPLRQSSRANDVSWGPGGFVIGGVRHEGEFPHPLAWHSSDGETWTGARIDALPGPAGESPFDLMAPFEGGYLSAGHRLQEAASFFFSKDGVAWTQVDDLFGEPLSRVSAMAVSDDALVAGGETENRAFIWSAPRP